jgi:hypothetical protein
LASLGSQSSGTQEPQKQQQRQTLLQLRLMFWQLVLLLLVGRLFLR